MTILAKRLFLLIGAIAAAPLVFLIVAIRPIILLRFGTMISHRIGHFAVDVEAYLCVRDREKPRRQIVDIIGCPAPVCNRQLQTMWARTLRITPGARLWRMLDRACRFWTRGDTHHVKLYDRRSDYELFLTTEPHLSFTNEEHQRGRELLEQLGIPAGTPWICIHNRDAAYLEKALGGHWAYHDYRDFSVKDMVCAAEELSRRGYYVLRMGAIVSAPLVSSNLKIIDYSSSGFRGDFADIYLLANCSAFIGGDAGIGCVPLIFRKPIAYINFSPTLIDILLITLNVYPLSLPFIMKRLWHKETQRFLSLREMFELGLAGASESYLFEEAGVELICNTPEEIRDLAIEVDDRLKGNWQPQPGDDVLQQRFWSIYRQYASPVRQGNGRALIGATFIRKHSYLLS